MEMMELIADAPWREAVTCRETTCSTARRSTATGGTSPSGAATGKWEE